MNTLNPSVSALSSGIEVGNNIALKEAEQLAHLLQEDAITQGNESLISTFNFALR